MALSLQGKTFGRLTVLNFSHSNKHKNRVWLCKCECGNSTLVSAKYLKRGHTKSCGCLMRDMATENSTTHGLRKTRMYSSWYDMIKRCCNSKASLYKYYGGRNIKVCDRWKDIKNFYKDMGERPAGLTIERIDNNGDYCLKNCKWATMKEQSINKRNSKHLRVLNNA